MAADPPTKGRNVLLDQLGDEKSRSTALLRLTKSHVQPKGFFRGLAQRASIAVGRPWAFVSAVAAVLIWAGLGPIFGFSDTWQLVINTATTIITFLMVFLIQSAQNRDTEAIRLKLDALILSMQSVSNTFVDLESLSDEELDRLRARLKALASD